MNAFVYFFSYVNLTAFRPKRGYVGSIIEELFDQRGVVKYCVLTYVLQYGHGSTFSVLRHIYLSPKKTSVS
jgi:hypothetical protein